jgi:hypothetical protein
MKKKKIYSLVVIAVFFSILFLSNKSNRYTGINYTIEKERITNFQKISDFYKRSLKYKNLVETINKDTKNKKKRVINTSLWIYKNIKKISLNSDIIDSHPWTIIERKMGAKDQFSDILSVLLIYCNIDSFYIDQFNKTSHPLTFFKYNESWSIIDPYYGVYFSNNKGSFSSISEIKDGDWIMEHLIFGKIKSNNIDKIFFDKNFHNKQDLNTYYKNLFSNLPSSKKIDATKIYYRGGRSYIQKPFYRILYQLREIFLFVG